MGQPGWGSQGRVSYNSITIANAQIHSVGQLWWCGVGIVSCRSGECLRVWILYTVILEDCIVYLDKPEELYIGQLGSIWTYLYQ